MKVIKTVQSVVIEAFNGPGIYRGEETEQLLRQAEENRSKVIYGAGHVESFLELLAIVFFFRDHPDPEKGALFSKNIAHASWFNFEAKRQVTMEIAKALKAGDSSWIKTFDERLRDVIRYRNAFTHGGFSTNGRDVKLTWFSGEQKFRIIDDEWLTKIETRLMEAQQMAAELQIMISPKWTPEVEASLKATGLYREPEN